MTDLLSLAKAATPGPWHLDRWHVIGAQRAEGGMTVPATVASVVWTEDAAYINMRMSPELMELLFIRDGRGQRLVVDWGEPDADGFYCPVITAVDDGMVLVDRDSLARALHESMVGCYWDESANAYLCVPEFEDHANDAAAILAALRGES